MPILLKRGQKIAGVDCPSGLLVIGLEKEVEAKIIEGGTAVATQATALAYTDPATGKLYSNGVEMTALNGLVSGGGNFDATDSGTNWASAPAALAIQAVLTVGTTTTVLLEVMDKAATVTTAATITADTISQVLNITVALVGAAQYRLRRSTGTGTVNLLVQR
jgi:hypothetical protein